jgi:hypothetical protein
VLLVGFFGFFTHGKTSLRLRSPLVWQLYFKQVGALPGLWSSLSNSFVISHLRLYVDWGSRFVGDVNWSSLVGTVLSGPTLSVL